MATSFGTKALDTFFLIIKNTMGTKKMMPMLRPSTR